MESRMHGLCAFKSTGFVAYQKVSYLDYVWNGILPYSTILKMSSDLYIKLPKLTYTYNVLTFPAKTIVAVKHQQFTFHTN